MVDGNDPSAILARQLIQSPYGIPPGYYAASYYMQMSKLYRNGQITAKQIALDAFLSHQINSKYPTVFQSYIDCVIKW